MHKSVNAWLQIGRYAYSFFESARCHWLLFTKVRFLPLSTKSRVGIGPNVVSGVMISMKSIDMYILHDSSLGVCFSKRS